MAEYGLVLHRFRDTTLIDSQYPVYIFQEAGSWYRPYDAGDPASATGVEEITFVTEVAEADGPPIVAIRPHSDRATQNQWNASMSGIVLDGSDYSGFNIDWAYTTTKNDGDEVDWVVFRKIGSADATSTDYGLDTFDSSGDITWSSNKRGMVIVAAYEYLLTEMNGYIGFQVLDPQNNYFFFYPPWQEMDDPLMYRMRFHCKTNTDWVSPKYSGPGQVGWGTPASYPMLYEVTY